MKGTVWDLGKCSFPIFRVSFIGSSTVINIQRMLLLTVTLYLNPSISDILNRYGLMTTEEEESPAGEAEKNDTLTSQPLSFLSLIDLATLSHWSHAN